MYRLVGFREPYKTADVEAGVVASTFSAPAVYLESTQVSRSAFVEHSVCSTWGMVVPDFWFVFTKGHAQGEWQDEEERPHVEVTRCSLAVGLFREIFKSEIEQKNDHPTLPNVGFFKL